MSQHTNFIKKLIKLDYNTTKGIFYDLFHCHSMTYSTNTKNMYLLNNDRTFDFILKQINLTRKEYNYLYYTEYRTDVISYTNAIHNVNHLWKPIDTMLINLKKIKNMYSD